MENLYKKQLFSKFILVNDLKEPIQNNFEALFSLANILNIKIVEGQELASLDVFKFASEMLGEDVPQPFYKGFPESVRALTPDQLLFDQLVHYQMTYGFGNFSEAGHSLFEEQFEKIAFKEKTKVKEFRIVNTDEAKTILEEIVDNLLLSSRPLSLENMKFVETYISEFNYQIKECNSKDTLIKLLVHLKNIEISKFLSLSDFLKVVELLNYENYNGQRINKLNLNNQDRKFLTKVLDKLLENKFRTKDCYERQNAWCGVLHHIHYKPKNENAVEFVNKMRSGENESTYSEFESLLNEGKVRDAVDVLIRDKGSAMVIRKMNYIISRCKTDEEIEYVLNAIETKNNIVLIQNLLKYSVKRNKSLRIFKFAKFNKLKIHEETKIEAEKRKSVISDYVKSKICVFLENNLKKNLSGKLGKVYIDDGMELIALPIQESTSMSGFNVLPRGSRINIGEMKKIRAFVYWEKVNDIDLSVLGIDDDFNSIEFSWRTMAGRQSKGITFSGDEVAGYSGGSEYFDIDLKKVKKEYPKLKYLIFNANVYSYVPFSKCVCCAGFMQRDIVHSGEIFEPKTVETSFSVNCDSTFESLFAIDLEKRQVIWLNVAMNDNLIVAGDSNKEIMAEYFNFTEVMNMKKFFKFLATEVVINIEDADVIVSDRHFENVEGKEIIRSFDIDKILKLMNE